MASEVDGRTIFYREPKIMIRVSESKRSSAAVAVWAPGMLGALDGFSPVGWREVVQGSDRGRGARLGGVDG